MATKTPTRPKTNYSAVKKQHSDMYNKAFEDAGVFWAFSNEQFDENKTPLAPGDKYVSIGSGGFLPRSNFDQMMVAIKAANKWEKEAMRSVKAEQAILYELNNYEAFYSGDLTDSMDVLGPMGYTIDQVRAVYNANKNRIMQERD